jgi:hypothetical protein
VVSALQIFQQKFSFLISLMRILCPDLTLLDLMTTSIPGPFAKFVNWRQGAAVMQREAVTWAKL